MGCDAAVHRRKRRWEKDQASLSSEKGGIGFANIGHPSKQVWCEWDDTPFPTFWSWVPQYRLLTDSPSVPIIALNYEGDPIEIEFDISISSIGFTHPQVDMLGREFTVALIFTCIVTEVDFPIITVHRQVSGLNLFAPLPTDSYRFEIWGGFINDQSVGGVLPGCTVYPLDRCHDCTDDP